MTRKVHPVISFVVVIVVIILILFLGLLSFLAITEYKPKDMESLDVFGNTDLDSKAKTDTDIDIISWNIGYCGLGEEEDFFMDNGKNVQPGSKEEVQNNLNAVIDKLKSEDCDIMLLQEIDQDSTRSYHINQSKAVSEEFSDYQSVFANNFKCAFVPYPLPPIGKVDSGIQITSKYSLSDTVRYQLPIPFKWPVSMANLKRCLQEAHISLEGTDKELVVFNLHLEAFDDGEGRIAQTKAVIEHINKYKENGDYVIVGGDFNQLFPSIDASAYPKQNEDNWQPGLLDETAFGEGWQFLMDNTNPTCRALSSPYDSNDPNFQYFMIDGFIASDNIQVNSINTIGTGFINTDHNPVKVSIKLLSE